MSRDLDVYTDVLSPSHVYQSAARACLNYSLAAQQRDRADRVLCCLDFLEIIQ